MVVVDDDELQFSSTYSVEVLLMKYQDDKEWNLLATISVIIIIIITIIIIIINTIIIDIITDSHQFYPKSHIDTPLLT